MGGHPHTPAALPQGNTRYRRLGGPQGRVRNISPPPGFDLRTDQPTETRFTDSVIPAHLDVYKPLYSFSNAPNTGTVS